MKQVVEYQGKNYVWTGSTWYGEKDFLNPPSGIIPRLNDLIADANNILDDEMTDPREMIRLASALRDSKGQNKRALKLARKAYQLMPNDAPTASVLSSMLRVVNRPEEAIEVTDKLLHIPYPPMWTSRAAAFCDLEKWPDALSCIKRALAMSQGQKNGETFSVWQRIKSEAPQLFS